MVVIVRWLLYRQVGIVVSLAVWQTGGCYCKVVAIGRQYSCVSGSMADRLMLL